MTKPTITIATLNEMSVKELRAAAKMLKFKLGRMCATKNAIKLAIVHHLEEMTTRKLALAKAEAAKSEMPSKAEKIAKVITEPKRKKDVTSARMEVIRTLVELCGEQSGVNDTWIWIFESNEQNWSGDHALILTD